MTVYIYHNIPTSSALRNIKKSYELICPPPEYKRILRAHSLRILNKRRPTNSYGRFQDISNSLKGTPSNRCRQIGDFIIQTLLLFLHILKIANFVNYKFLISTPLLFNLFHCGLFFVSKI